MTALILGLIIFLGVHSTSIVKDAWRNRMASNLGEKRWKSIYALVSGIGFILIIWGFGSARMNPTVLYVPPAGLRPVAFILLLPVFTLLFAAYLPGRIKSATRHPMLAAVMLWSLAHLLVNGTLATFLLFGSFLIWAVADRISVMRRAQRPVPGPPPSRYNDLIAVVVGLALYAAFLFGMHQWLIGVSVLPV